MHAEVSLPLPGENVAPPVAEEIAGWIVIYEELTAVLSQVIDRAGESPHTNALRTHREWAQDRLAALRDRHAAISGIRVDRRSITHGGRTVRLTRREAELLDFLLRHPRRQFTARELVEKAWRNPWLSDAQVRTYLMRLRRRLGYVGLDGVANLPRSRGYGVRRRSGHDSSMPHSELNSSPAPSTRRPSPD